MSGTVGFPTIRTPPWTGEATQLVQGPQFNPQTHKGQPMVNTCNPRVRKAERGRIKGSLAKRPMPGPGQQRSCLCTPTQGCLRASTATHLCVQRHTYLHTQRTMLPDNLINDQMQSGLVNKCKNSGNHTWKFTDTTWKHMTTSKQTPQ